MALFDEFEAAKSAPKQSLGTDVPAPSNNLFDQFEASRKPVTSQESLPAAGEFSFFESLERGTKILGANVLEAGGFQQEASELLASAPAAGLPNFRQIEDAENVAQFVGERTLESAPNIGLSLTTASIGALFGGPIGAAIGFSLGAGTPLLGEARREIREEGGEGTPLEALPSAAANTALEALPIGKIARALGIGKVFQRSVDEVLEEAAEEVSTVRQVIDKSKEVGELALTEGAVETMQELNNKLAGRFFADKEVLALEDEDIEQLKQAFAGGLGGGTGAGIVAQTTGAALGKVEEIQARKKKEAFRTSVEGQIQEIITDKKRALEGAGTVLREAGEQFQPGDFSVFRGLQGTERTGERGSLPVGDTGRGPQTVSNPGFAQKVEQLPAVAQDAEGNRVETPLISFKGTGKVRLHPSAEKPGSTVFDDGSVDHPTLFKEVQKILNEIVERMGITDLDVLIGQSAELRAALNMRPSPKASAASVNSEESMNVLMLDIANTVGSARTTSHALGNVVASMSHELGHAIIDKQWAKADATTQAGLLQGYREWLTDVEQMTAKQFWRKYNPLSLERRGGKPRAAPNMSMKEYMSKIPPESRAYLLSFDEYAAQMIARAIDGKIQKLGLLPEETAHWERLAAELKRIWEKVKETFKATPTFEAWIDQFFFREEIRRLEEARAEIANPTGERADVINQTRDEILAEHDEGTLSQPDYAPVTGNAMADVLEQMGLRREANDLRQHQDIQLGFLKLSTVLTPLQLANLAEKAGIQNPQRYMELVREFSNTKMQQIVRADEIAQKWRSLGKTKTTQLGNFIYALSTKSDEENRRLTPDELATLRRQHSVDDETFALWEEVDQSFQEVLANIERGLVFDAAKSFITDPNEARRFRDLYLQAPNRENKIDLIVQFTGTDLIPLEGDAISNPLFDELNRIEKSMAELRNRNYFPRTRLGQYIITIKATEAGQEWEGHTSRKRGDTLGFYAFDTKKERDAMLKSLKTDTTPLGLSITGSIMDTEVFAMMGMPEVLIQRVMEDGKVDLKPEQQEALRNISLNLSPGKRFLRHLKKRRGIAGFSDDALRVYSTYMMSAANHLARVEHAKSMVEALEGFNAKIKELELNNLGGDIGDMVALKNYFQRHFDYLMKPDNDWAQLRSLGFLWYLGFNVKSALVNLTQIPLVTFPVLAGRFGDGKASGALAGAYRDIPKLIKQNATLAEDEMAMLQTLRETGVLDESMVMELAGMGEADILKRTLPGWKLDNVMNKVAYYGGGMFRMAEKFNRNVTALAAYRLARDEGHPNPVEFAREAIEKSQFEYSKWNRAEFMRGKKSVIFLFWQYMQHASFLFFGGEGSKVAMRMWLLALFISGVEGLPFAKTLFEAVDLGGTAAQKALGVANPRVALREDMRDLLLQITDEPDAVLRGMASYWGLGPLHLLSLTGAPIPNVDISGSLSFGSPVQFLDEALVGHGNPDEELGKLTAAVLGPVGGMVLQGYRSMTSTDPDNWKRVERAMPVFFKNAMQGTRWIDEGKETFRGGGEFLNMDRPEHRVAAAMKFLGFQPTRLTQKYNQVTTQQEAAMFWTLRKQLLMEDYAYAHTTGDREGKKDVMDGIKAHNKAMRKTKGLQGLAISSKDMRNSLRARERSRVLRERGLPASEAQRPLFRELERLFPVSAR